MSSDLFGWRRYTELRFRSGYCIDVIKVRRETGLRLDWRAWWAIEGEVAKRVALF